MKVDLIFVKVIRDGEFDRFGYVAIINDPQLRKRYEEGDWDKSWLEPYLETFGKYEQLMKVEPDEIVYYIVDNYERNAFLSAIDTKWGYECFNGDILKKGNDL